VVVHFETASSERIHPLFGLAIRGKSAGHSNNRLWLTRGLETTGEKRELKNASPSKLILDTSTFEIRNLFLDKT
jgi:hypothetical protein